MSAVIFVMQISYIFVFLTLLHRATLECTSQSALNGILAPETKQEVFIHTDTSYTWTSQNFPNPYPRQTNTLVIKSDPGYSIAITIEKLDLDGDCGDLLLVKPGTSLESDGAGKIFTFNLKSVRKYVIHSNNVYISLRVLGDNTPDKTGYSITYRRIGEAFEATTANPSTLVTWPTPSGSDSIYFTGFVAGKAQDEFKNNQTLNDLKIAIVGMAVEYCQTNSIPVAEPITPANIQIYYIIQCPYTWPNYESCIKIRFALPVFLQDNSTWSGYQLNANNLAGMWNGLANSYLLKYNMSVYTEPDNSSSFTMWIIVSAVTLMLFAMLLYIMRIVGRSFAPKKLNDNLVIGDTKTDEFRFSNLSMNPHYLQSTPPFFGVDNHSYEEFVPDVDFYQKQKYSRATGNEYRDSDDSDEEIIYDNFSDSRNNIDRRNESQS